VNYHPDVQNSYLMKSAAERLFDGVLLHWTRTEEKSATRAASPRRWPPDLERRRHHDPQLDVPHCDIFHVTMNDGVRGEPGFPDARDVETSISGVDDGAGYP